MRGAPRGEQPDAPPTGDGPVPGGTDRIVAAPEREDVTWAARTRRIVRQNFAWALGYNLAVLPAAVLGWLPPYVAAIGMSASSLLVVLNSLRLRRAETPTEGPA